MHEMQAIATDIRGVCQSVCLSRGSTRLHCAKTGETDQDPLWSEHPWSSRNIVLDGGPDLSLRWKGKAHSMQLSPNYSFHSLLRRKVNNTE